MRKGLAQMAEQWKIGDVVRLKSGGPKMTVKLVGQHESVWCHWFDGPTIYTAEFDPNEIDRADGKNG
jgi:uncharacterized protein YodC (DUF2158 family)